MVSACCAGDLGARDNQAPREWAIRRQVEGHIEAAQPL